MNTLFAEKEKGLATVKDRILLYGDGQLSDETLIGFIVNNPRIMRTIPRLLSQAGLTLEETIPHIYTEVGTGSFFLGAAETYAPLIAQAGLLPADQVENWLSEQRKTHEDGTFFASGNYYTYLAKRV